MIQSQEATRRVTVEVIVGALVSAVFVLIFLDIPILAKTILVTFLGIVGVLNFVALTQQTNRLRSRLGQRRRDRLIRKRPDLISEFGSLINKIRRVLYERTSGRPSLALDGAQIMEQMTKEGDKTLRLEFTEKLAMANAEYEQIYQSYANHSFRRWKTLEYIEFLRSISSHLNTVGYIFQTVYRQSSLSTMNKAFSGEVRTKWESFKDEYNLVLHDWKAFTEKSDQSVGYGTATQAENAKSIPQMST